MSMEDEYDYIDKDVPFGISEMDTKPPVVSGQDDANSLRNLLA